MVGKASLCLLHTFQRMGIPYTLRVTGIKTIVLQQTTILYFYTLYECILNSILASD